MAHHYFTIPVLLERHDKMTAGNRRLGSITSAPSIQAEDSSQHIHQYPSFGGAIKGTKITDIILQFSYPTKAIRRCLLTHPHRLRIFFSDYHYAHVNNFHQV